jgi:hypothetical protein
MPGMAPTMAPGMMAIPATPAPLPAPTVDG